MSKSHIAKRRDQGRDSSGQPGSRRAERGPSTPLGTVRHDVLRFLRSKGVREVAESIVIAFALAFLFRTFEAEAFVIPTGSMAATLQGRHQYVTCPKCDYSFRISASSEVDQKTGALMGDVIGVRCPMCGYTTCTNLARGVVANTIAEHARAPAGVELHVFNNDAIDVGKNCSSRGGDRILVNKFAYDFADPQRWDIIVFRNPIDASKNFIKRLVGLPGERLRIHRGDIFRRAEDAAFEIVRKPPHKVLAMMQVVYDSGYVADEMTAAGWPTRWASWPRGAAALDGDWTSSDGMRSFATAGPQDRDVWIRYQHLVPGWDDWEALLENEPEAFDSRPQLIADAYAYNSGLTMLLPSKHGQSAASPTDPVSLGIHWVGDHILQCKLKVLSESGTAIFELVEGGVRFDCRVDIATGKATLSIDDGEHPFVDEKGTAADQPTADTSLRGPGVYQLTFANVDDQLHLWIDGAVVTFNGPTTYGRLGNVIPRTDKQGGGDLAPVGIGSRGAGLEVSEMRIFRDVYYTSVTYQTGNMSDYKLDSYTALSWNHRVDGLRSVKRRRMNLVSDPSVWPEVFNDMYSAEFTLVRFPNDQKKDQFFAMGDNSPQSKDSRLWDETGREFFVERRLLIGKAMVIYWPPWNWQCVR